MKNYITTILKGIDKVPDNSITFAANNHYEAARKVARLLMKRPEKDVIRCVETSTKDSTKEFFYKFDNKIQASGLWLCVKVED